MLLFFLIQLTFSLYNYSNHGDNWEGLCSTSFSQSPIDLNPSLIPEIPSTSNEYFYISLYYAPVRVINSNLSMTSEYSFNPSLNFNIYSNFGNIEKLSNPPIIYSSRSISIHYPAEHTFYGVTEHILEVQIQHVNPLNTSDLLVLSLLFKVGPDKNYFISQVIEGYYSFIGTDIDCNFANAAWVVVKNFYFYQGSDTTPPCTEGVLWVVNAETMHLSQSQLDFFSSKLNTTGDGGNYRYTMPQAGRPVKKCTESVFSAGLILTPLVFFLIST